LAPELDLRRPGSSGMGAPVRPGSLADAHGVRAPRASSAAGCRRPAAASSPPPFPLVGLDPPAIGQGGLSVEIEQEITEETRSCISVPFLISCSWSIITGPAPAHC